MTNGTTLQNSMSQDTANENPFLHWLNTQTFMFDFVALHLHRVSSKQKNHNYWNSTTVHPKESLGIYHTTCHAYLSRITSISKSFNMFTSTR